MKKQVKRCPKCDSSRIFSLRIDCDWGGPIGNYYPVNDPAEYTQEDLMLDCFDRPDVWVYHCLNCDHMWE